MDRPAESITLNDGTSPALEYRFVKVLQAEGRRGVLRECTAAPAGRRFHLDAPECAIFHASAEAAEAAFNDACRQALAEKITASTVCPFDGNRCTRKCSLFNAQNMRCWLSEALQGICNYFKTDENKNQL